MRKYFGSWKSLEDMHRDFIDYGGYDKGLRIEGFPTDEEIIFASYGQGSYEGDSLVLFQRGGDLFINDASHCSCYGLEGSWKPDMVLPVQLSSFKPSDWCDHGADALEAWDRLSKAWPVIQ